MPTVIGRSTCKKNGQKRPRPARGVWEDLSWMRGNSHVQFLGGGEAAMLPCYPTTRGLEGVGLVGVERPAVDPEQIEALKAPRTAPDGDAAITAVWQKVADEKTHRDERKQRQDAVLATAPASVRAAFELEGDEFTAALRASLAELPEAEAAALLQRLRDSGLIGGSAAQDMTQVLDKFKTVLQGIAAAVNDEEIRAQVEAVVADLEQKGWRLSEAVHRAWAGERDAESLTARLDEQDTALVRRVLEVLGQ